MLFTLAEFKLSIPVALRKAKAFPNIKPLIVHILNLPPRWSHMETAVDETRNRRSLACFAL